VAGVKTGEAVVKEAETVVKEAVVRLVKRRHGARSPVEWLHLRRRDLLIDGGFAAAVVLIDAVLTAFLPPELRATGSVGTATLFAVACAVPIMLRRAATWWAVLIFVAMTIAGVATAAYPLSHQVGLFAVAYTTAARFPVRPAVLAALLLWLPVAVVNLLADQPTAATGDVAVPAAFLVLANVLVALVLFFIGRTVRGHRAAAQGLQERASAAEANQRALASHAVADERRRIARELHDVVAHHISVIGVLSTGARRVLRKDPDAAEDALATIADTSRVTLREMRRLLDVLRTDEEADADLAPQPGLAGIEALVEQVRDAGLPVRWEVAGEPVALEAGVALTVYRIVQEALTNTLKHAGEASASVCLRFTGAGLEVEICDDGRGPSPHSGDGVGHGLVGMRERVALYGGTLHTGHRPGGGFLVRAVIPAEQLGPPA
jgi:signal transduction histidine kinase